MGASSRRRHGIAAGRWVAIEHLPGHKAGKCAIRAQKRGRLAFELGRLTLKPRDGEDGLGHGFEGMHAHRETTLTEGSPQYRHCRLSLLRIH